jgi:hypothetical protein
MLFTIDLFDTIEVNDPITFCKNKEDNSLELLKHKFIGRNYNGHHIVDIQKIKRLSRCSIIPSNLSVKGRIYVQFTALINSVDPYIANMRVGITEPRVTCASEDKSVIAGLTQSDAHKIIQKGQYIPIKVEKSAYDPFKKSVTVSGSLLHCDTSVTVYKTAGVLTKEHAKDLLYKVNTIKKELELRSEQFKSNEVAYVFFEQLLYSYKHTDKNTVSIPTKDAIDWNGPTQVKKTSSPTVNLLELITLASDSDVDVTGYWSRPLEIYRSCPLVVKTDLSSGPGSTFSVVEQPPHVVMADLLNSMIIIKTIRELAEHFNTKEKFVSHKNIWKVIQNYQLTA